MSGVTSKTLLLLLLHVLVTVGAFLYAWWHPQDTGWQFWVFSQCMPLFYLLLSAWGALK